MFFFTETRQTLTSLKVFEKSSNRPNQEAHVAVRRCNDTLLYDCCNHSLPDTVILKKRFGDPWILDAVEKCKDRLNVPNVVHFVWLYEGEISLFQFISLISVLRWVVYFFFVNLSEIRLCIKWLIKKTQSAKSNKKYMK